MKWYIIRGALLGASSLIEGKIGMIALAACFGLTYYRYIEEKHVVKARPSQPGHLPV